MPKYLDGAGLSHFWESIKPKLGGVAQSGSGTVVTSDDAANLPPLSLTIHGKSVQDGTPSPSSPVEIKSVRSPNLQPFFSKDFSDTSYWYYPPFTSGGVGTDTTPTATQLSDGWAHVEWSGTVSRRQLTAMTPAMPTDGSIKPSSTYTLMVEVRNYSATGTNAQMIFPATDGTKAPWTANTYQGALSNGTFLYTAATKADISAATQLRCFMVACNGVSTSTTFSLSFDIRLSLYEGSYAGNYMPYGSINLMTCGDNLFANPTALMRNGVMRTELLTMSGDTITNSASNGSHGTYCYYPAFVLPSDGSITVSADVYLTGTHATSNVFMAILDGKATPASDVAPSYTVGISKNAWTHVEHTFTINSGHSAGEKAMLALMAANTGNTLQLKNVMLQAGSTATAYEPYSSTTTPIPVALRSLPDGTEDTLEVDGEGNVTLTKRVGEITYNGSESWGVNQNVGSGFAYTPKPSDMASGDGSASVQLMLADRFVPKNASTGGNVYASGSNLLFYRDGSSFNPSSTAEAKAWFAANPTTVIYKLASEQTIPLGKIDLPSLPSPSFSLHVDAAVTPTLDAEWWTQGGGKVIDAVSTRITALEADVTELQGQVPEREVLYDTSTWTVIRYGRTVMVQVHGATATPSTSTALITGILADCKPAYNCSATVLTSSGSSTQAARMAVYADTGDVYIVPAGYSSSASWYGTLTYIY